MKTVPKPYSKEAAKVSLLIDLNNGNLRPQRAYARIWGWSRGRVRYHFPELKKAAESWPFTGKEFSPPSAHLQPTLNPKNGPKSNKRANEKPTLSPPSAHLQPTTTHIRDNRKKCERGGAPSRTPVYDNPPTLEQVEAYAIEYINSDTNKILPHLISDLAPSIFHNHYSGTNWTKAKGEPLTDWRNAFRGWLMRDQKRKLERLQKA